MTTIVYHLSVEGENPIRFAVDTEGRTRNAPVSGDANWTALEFHQCPNCTLRRETHAHCPAALEIADIAHTFQHVESHKPVRVDVEMHGRIHTARTDAQSALHSLMGLAMALSDCPVLSRLRGPARLHMPFATIEETLFRMVGAYLLGQYLQAQRGEKPDWNLGGLVAIYEQVQEINLCLKQRLNAIARSDANLNAVVSLMSMAMLVNFSLDQKLQDLLPYVITRPQAD